MKAKPIWTMPAERCGGCSACRYLLTTLEHFANTPTDRKQWAQVVAASPCERPA